MPHFFSVSSFSLFRGGRLGEGDEVLVLLGDELEELLALEPLAREKPRLIPASRTGQFVRPLRMRETGARTGKRHRRGS